MSSRFESPQWHSAIASLVRGREMRTICGALTAAIDVAVENDGTCLLSFNRDAPPNVLHHSMPPAIAEHYIDRYLDGPYLLDPLYGLALRTERPTVCRFRDQTPDRFRFSEYYRQYCERTHLRDEMDFLLRVSGTTTIVLVVGRFQKMFSKAELERLQLIADIVYAAIRNIWEQCDVSKLNLTRDEDFHRRLTHCFAGFGDSELTDREQQIAQLLLRGHSAKSVARELRIAPGTVMVHKRNLFAKLKISSQYELFSLFINKLSTS